MHHEGTSARCQDAISTHPACPLSTLSEYNESQLISRVIRLGQPSGAHNAQPHIATCMKKIVPLSVRVFFFACSRRVQCVLLSDVRLRCLPGARHHLHQLWCHRVLRSYNIGTGIWRLQRSWNKRRTRTCRTPRIHISSCPSHLFSQRQVSLSLSKSKVSLRRDNEFFWARRFSFDESL